jgi:hypothetical protein
MPNARFLQCIKQIVANPREVQENMVVEFSGLPDWTSEHDLLAALPGSCHVHIEQVR